MDTFVEKKILHVMRLWAGHLTDFFEIYSLISYEYLLIVMTTSTSVNHM